MPQFLIKWFLICEYLIFLGCTNCLTEKQTTLVKGPFIDKVTGGGQGNLWRGHLKNICLLGGSNVKNGKV